MLIRFVRDGWGHKAGETVEFKPDFATTIIAEGYAVPADAPPPVERAVAPEPAKRTAVEKRG